LTINLESSQQLQNLEIELRPSAAISGKVTDRDGDPIVATEVRAMMPTYQNGQRILRVVQSTLTNDLGEYRFFGLPSGQYYVSVIPSADTPFPTPIVNSNVLGSSGVLPPALLSRPRVAIYYPSTTDSRIATPIDLTGGGDFGGVNITVLPSKPLHIRGNVPGGMARVTLVPADPGLTGSIRDTDAANGPFDFANIASGEYTLGRKVRRTVGNGIGPCRRWRPG
jgi:hypothetical protein